jgi:DNA-binding CsgD family transcriptional regulator
MSPDDIDSDRGWEGPEGHRFALEVLQLTLRRSMLRLVAGGIKDAEQIGQALKISPALVEYHLTMLEKALVVERSGEGWRATPTGLLFLEKVDGGK